MNTVDKREEPKKNRGLNEQNYVEIAEEVIEKLSQKKDKEMRKAESVPEKGKQLSRKLVIYFFIKYCQGSPD